MCEAPYIATEIETPKAFEGESSGVGCSQPTRRGPGSVVSSRLYDISPGDMFPSDVFPLVGATPDVFFSRFLRYTDVPPFWLRVTIKLRRL